MGIDKQKLNIIEGFADDYIRGLYVVRAFMAIDFENQKWIKKTTFMRHKSRLEIAVSTLIV